MAQEELDVWREIEDLEIEGSTLTEEDVLEDKGRALLKRVGEGISRGLEHINKLNKLVVLDLSKNRITTLEWLRSETLQYAYLDENPIRFMNIEDSSALPRLEYLSLYKTQIWNAFLAVKSLLNLKKLVRLRFGIGRKELGLDFLSSKYIRMPGYYYSGRELQFFEYGTTAEIPSETPIRIKQYYVSFMLFTMPKLVELDEVVVSDRDRKIAVEYIQEHFKVPILPNTIDNMESFIELLFRREFDLHDTSPVAMRNRMESSMTFFERKSVLPILEQFIPRQFEFSIKDENMAVLGTIYGDIVLFNSLRGVAIGEERLFSRPILGISWLKQESRRVVVGDSFGHISMINTEILEEKPRNEDGSLKNSTICTFQDCPELTSVNSNLNDNLLIASGYGSAVPLYDIVTNRLIGRFDDIHEDHINVSKFKHTDPFVFATTSFDGNSKFWDTRLSFEQEPVFAIDTGGKVVTLAFTDDDKYILTSGVDNYMSLYDTRNGKKALDLKTPKLNATHNYTRGYFMNNSEYVVSGSCRDSCIYLFETTTGKLVAEIETDYRDYVQEFGSLYVQSLRGDNFNRNRIIALLSNSQSTFFSRNYLFRLHAIELM